MSNIPTALIRMTFLALVLIFGVLLVAAILSVHNAFNDDPNNGDICREISETVGEYNLCMGMRKCEDKFGDNSDLVGSCYADLWMRGRP